MTSNFKPAEIFEDLSLLSSEELRSLVFEASNFNDFFRQIVLVKCAIKKSKKEVSVLKSIIDEALAYERPFKDPNWGNYDYYLYEIKKSILSVKNELSLSELKEVLIYLAERAENDEVVGEFDEDGEWGLAIDDIKNHLFELEK
ncbi:MAG: hypothetical protein PHY93_17785 [Bacteriovorax sp.]|nr:hypothetical protein [Bacteriovorax sp.]